MTQQPEIPDLDTSALSGVKSKSASEAAARISTILVVPLALGLVIIILLFYVLYTGTKVDGESMLPSLRPEDRVLVTKSYGAPVRGDVVVAEVLEEDGMVHDVIKRLVAVPGDTVSVVDDVVYVNGAEEDTSGLLRLPGGGVEIAEFTLGPGEVYLLGDNRAVSYDSRYVGPVPEADIKGKAVGIYAPLPRIGPVR